MPGDRSSLMEWQTLPSLCVTQQLALLALSA